MLVLRRRIGEQLVIAGTITVTVLAVEGNRVKIGITAPEEIPVVREELFHVEQEEKQTSEGETP